MADYDKVVKGLERLCEHLFHVYEICYKGDEEDNYNWFLAADDALALLKEQGPRIIPFDEINNYEVLWLEVKGVETEEGLAPWVKTRNERWFSPLICNSEHPDMILSRPDEYGKFCRCWTARPTDEQRKMVKWEWV